MFRSHRPTGWKLVAAFGAVVTFVGCGGSSSVFTDGGPATNDAQQQPVSPSDTGTNVLVVGLGDDSSAGGADGTMGTGTNPGDCEGAACGVEAGAPAVCGD